MGLYNKLLYKAIFVRIEIENIFARDKIYEEI